MTAWGTVGTVAERVGGRVIGDAAVEIERVSAIDDADERALTFATDARYLRTALASRAAAVLTDESLAAAEPAPAKPLVAVASTRVAMATLLAEFAPPLPRGPYRAPTAAVEDGAEIAPDAWLGPQSAVGAGAVIGAATIVGAGVVIGPGARIGANCILHPRSYVAAGCIVGDRVVLQAGAVVGSDGFGFAFLEGRLRKIPQIGIVSLGDDVEIGANTCIDRAQTGVTSIGNGTKIDNLCQIGHNCRIGSHTAIAALNGLAGTTTIGDFVQVGGQSGFAGHLTVGSRVTIAGATHVWSDIPDGAFVSGRPAQNHREELKLQAYLRRLPKLYERVASLERATRLDLPRE